MVIDAHVHIPGMDAERYGNYLAPSRRRRIAFRFLMRRFGLTPADLDRAPPDDAVLAQTLTWLEESRIDHAVFLALDAAYRPDGSRDQENTVIVTANDYVADIAAECPRVWFGASIHPYRPDAVDELERLLERGACLVKWIPGLQNIEPESSICIPFYKALARLRVPLLTHAGIEHVASPFSYTLNDPRRLETALRCGVTVIAAHCGAPLFLHDRSYFRHWARLVREHDNLYGDVSAFVTMPRGYCLARILRDSGLLERVVYGSDFPVPMLPTQLVFWTGVRSALALRRVTNPFDQTYLTLQRAGLPEEAFSLAGKLLRVPEAKN